MELKILHGNNIELLKGYPDNYFDSVVTDCPYGLSKEPNAVKLLQDWIDHGYHEIKGKGFMDKEWDAFVPQPLFWKEVFRVLKPGGYVLAFFGTRTYDWGTLAIRIAGFEIRDMICWHYGSGFPKSLDISKQLDKKAGAKRTVIRIDQSKVRVNSEKNHKNGQVANLGLKSGGSGVLTEASTDEAKQWEGYGTALKPATEPICMARKPIEGTVAENVLKYGTGGINLDGCRIGETGARNNGRQEGTKGIYGKIGSTERIEYDYGRFPANVIFDPFMGNELDKQTGILISGKPCGTKKALNNIYGHYEPGQDITGFGDSGGASRFFYCAKASQFERNAGCDDLEQKTGGMISNTSGQNLTRRENDYEPTKVGNNHPTVKPISLMSYIQRLVTPKGGKTLDPFAGSGTSGCSAYFENIGEIVLMEMDPTYLPIIEARTKYWSKEYNRRKYLEDIKDEPEQPKSQLKLFTE